MRDPEAVLSAFQQHQKSPAFQLEMTKWDHESQYMDPRAEKKYTNTPKKYN